MPCPGLCLGGHPLPSAPTQDLGRWSLSQAHLPVCQQGALNIRELLGGMYGSESPCSKRSPRWCVSVLGRGNPARESPRCWQAGESCGHLHWFFLPHETTRKFPTAGLVESSNPYFRILSKLSPDPVSVDVKNLHNFPAEFALSQFPIIEFCCRLGSPGLLLLL